MMDAADNQKNSENDSDASAHKEKEPMDARRVLEKPRMFGDYISWQAALAGGMGIIVIIVSAFVYEHIDKPKILWLAYAGIAVILACATKSVIDYLESRSEIAKDRAATHPMQPGEKMPTTSPASAPATQTGDNRQPIDAIQLTLRELFDSDFNKYGHCSGSIALKFKDGREVTFPYLVVTDFSARMKFLAFFISRSEHALENCQAIATCYQTAFEAVEGALIMRAGRSGELASTDLKDLTFSGRIYIYYEDSFTLQQLASLETLFKSNNAAAIFRGSDYLTSRWMATIARSSESKPA